MAPRTALDVGVPAIVLADGLNVRNGPGEANPVQTIAPGAPTSGQPIRVGTGDVVWIIGVEDAEGEAWYEVVLDRSFITGWISGGPIPEPWVAAFDRSDCPDSFTEGLAAGEPVVGSMRQLACFGNQQVGALVYWLPADAQQSVPCPWPDLEPTWLVCYEWVNASGDATAQLPIYDTQGRDDIRRGEWVTVIGHYDDPRSADCPLALGRDPADESDAAATVLSCRVAFVVDEIRDPVAP